MKRSTDRILTPHVGSLIRPPALREFLEDPLSRLLGKLARTAQLRRSLPQHRRSGVAGASGGYSIELANPRHEHEWRLWEHLKLPPDTVLIPGVISHATNIVEHPELVAERIVRLVGRENV